MSSTLRQVLEYFEQSQGAVALPQLARTLGIERDTLQNMLEHWVRKGKLREVSTCATCGTTAGCPFVVTLPRHYELVTANSVALDETACSCGGGCH